MLYHALKTRRYVHVLSPLEKEEEEEVEEVEEVVEVWLRCLVRHRVRSRRT